MEQQERFCSRCGKDSLAAQTAPRASQSSGARWEFHVKLLAWIYIVAAILLIVPGTILFSFFGISRHMFHGSFPLAGPMWALMIPLFLPIPLVIAAAGIGLLKYREWARVLTLVLAVFLLMAFPFGTALGAYAFWVLLISDGSAAYKTHATASYKV
jgi:hypothetical protein